MKVSMIYMASGFGKRYGTNKLITEFRGEPLYLHGLLSLQKAAKLLEKTEKINCQLILISQYERVADVYIVKQHFIFLLNKPKDSVEVIYFNKIGMISFNMQKKKVIDGFIRNKTTSYILTFQLNA